MLGYFDVFVEEIAEIFDGGVKGVKFDIDL